MLCTCMAAVLSAPARVERSASKHACQVVQRSLGEFESRTTSSFGGNGGFISCIEVCRLGERRQLCNGHYVFRSGVLLTDHLCNMTKGVCKESYSCPNETVLHPRETDNCADVDGRHMKSANSTTPGEVDYEDDYEDDNTTLTTSKSRTCTFTCQTVNKVLEGGSLMCTRAGELKKVKEMAGCVHVDKLAGKRHDFIHGHEVKFLRMVNRKGKVQTTRRVCVCLNGEWLKRNAVRGHVHAHLRRRTKQIFCKVSNASPIAVHSPFCGYQS